VIYWYIGVVALSVVAALVVDYIGDKIRKRNHNDDTPMFV
jgi:hypothetical protein